MMAPIPILRLVTKRDLRRAGSNYIVPRGAFVAWLSTVPFDQDDYADVTGLDDEGLSAKFAELFPDWFPEPPKPPTRVAIVQGMVNDCRAIFRGKGAPAQGCALADLIATWLRGWQSAKHRKSARIRLMKMVDELIDTEDS